MSDEVKPLDPGITNIATDMNKNEHNKKKNKNSPSIKELFAFYDGRLPKKIRLKETAI